MCTPARKACRSSSLIRKSIPGGYRHGDEQDRRHSSTAGTVSSAVMARCRFVDQHEVLALYRLLADHHIEVWLDGGWGIDALIGEQTRPHSDLDIAVRHDDVEELRTIMKARGYEPVERDDTQPWMFVLGDTQGHEVDVHSFTFDRHGKNIYG